MDDPLSSIALLLAQATAHPDPGGSETATSVAVKLLAVALLVVINGFFVASEFALVGLRKTRVEEMVRQGVRGSKAVKRGQDQLNDFIAASQLGITMASLALGWIGEPAVASLLKPMLGFLDQYSTAASHVISIGITFAIVTTLHIVLGEQVPKMWAIQHAERAALYTAGPTEIFLKAFSLCIKVLSWLTDLVLFRLGLRAAGHHGDGVYSEEEIRHLLRERQMAGEAEPLENEMIGKVFTFFDLVATQIMVPRTEMVCISGSATMRELAELAKSELHDRYPVYGDNLDDIRGVVVTRELISCQDLEERVTEHMRPVASVPGSQPVSALMARMKNERTRVLIVLDEYGGTAGMVTLGDLLERIVGEVEEASEDTAESEPPDIVPQDDGSVLISGLLLTEDVADYIGTEIEDEHNDTIGGVVFSLLGRKPEVGDEVRVNGHKFTVEALDGLRIDRLRVERADKDRVEEPVA